MKMTYEKETGSAYIYLDADETKKSSKTVLLNDNVIADIDESGEVIGIEILAFKDIYGYEPESINVELLSQDEPIKLYTVDEAAEIIKVNSDTIRRYIREGKIKASKVGKTYRIKHTDIIEFLG